MTRKRQLKREVHHRQEMKRERQREKLALQASVRERTKELLDALEISDGVLPSSISMAIVLARQDALIDVLVARGYVDRVSFNIAAHEGMNIVLGEIVKRKEARTQDKPEDET